MTALYTDHMKQQATYWPPGANDGFGGLVMGSPVLVMCRWEDNAVLYRDASGNEATSSAVVYPAYEVVTGGWLALGDLTGVNPPPKGLATAFEIRQVGKSPSLEGDQVLYKAYL